MPSKNNKNKKASKVVGRKRTKKKPRKDRKKVPLDLEKLKACSEAVDKYEEVESFQDVWDQCDRGDWLLWALVESKAPVDKATLVKSCVDCCKLIVSHTKGQLIECTDALTLVEDWANNGGVSAKQIQRAGSRIHPNVSVLIDDNGKRIQEDIHTRSAVHAIHALTKLVFEDKYASTVCANVAESVQNRQRSKEIAQECADIVRGYFPVAPNISE